MFAILLGPPGSGKGTQAAKLAQEMSLVHLSTGDILRNAIKSGADLGLKAKGFMESGSLVPDDLILDLIRERLSSGGLDFLFDGFPRTVPQADGLQGMLSEMGSKVDVVLNIQVSDREVVKRLSGRFFCPSCQMTYNYPGNLPVREGRCDKCDVELARRKDDSEEVVANRLKVYKDQTQPLLQYYRSRGLLRDVDGERSIDMVSRDLAGIIGAVAH